MCRNSLIVAVLLFNVVACDEYAMEGEALAIPNFVLSEEPLATIGGDDERPEHQLQYAEAALRLSDGRIVLADAGSAEVRYYDSQGDPIAVFGGEGQGPGEFQYLRSIVRISADTLGVWDAGLQRLTLLAPDGTLASTFSIPALSSIKLTMGRDFSSLVSNTEYVYPLGNGRILVEPRVQPVSWTVDGVYQDTVRYALLDSQAEEWMDLGPYPAWERFAYGGGLGPLPFGRHFRVAISEGQIVLGATDETELRVISPETGELVRTIKLPLERREVSPEDIEEYRRQIVASFISPNPESVVEMLDAVPWPQEFPAFTSLRAGGEGLLWVQAYLAPTDSTQVWYTIQGNGELVGRVTLGASEQFMDGGRDYVLVRVRDELDIEEIRLHELIQVP